MPRNYCHCPIAPPDRCGCVKWAGEQITRNNAVARRAWLEAGLTQRRLVAQPDGLAWSDDGGATTEPLSWELFADDWEVVR